MKKIGKTRPGVQQCQAQELVFCPLLGSCRSTLTFVQFIQTCLEDLSLYSNLYGAWCIQDYHLQFFFHSKRFLLGLQHLKIVKIGQIGRKSNKDLNKNQNIRMFKQFIL